MFISLIRLKYSNILYKYYKLKLSLSNITLIDMSKVVNNYL